MDRYWELLCVTCTHDLDDKQSLSLVEPLTNQPLAICQLDLRESTTYQPPKSTATQSQICRFMQEAIQAQFHLMRISSDRIDLDRIEKALRLAGKQFDFFLKCHQWQAQVHSAIFMPAHLLLDSDSLGASIEPLLDHSLLGEYPDRSSLENTPEERKREALKSSSSESHAIEGDIPLKILCVGQPHICEFSSENSELKSILATTTQPKRGFGEHYPFTLEVIALDIPRTMRLLIGNPNWQQVRPSLLLRLFREPFFNLIPLLFSLIPGGEIDHHPFFLVQISEPAGFWLRAYSKSLQLAKHLFYRFMRPSKRDKT